MIQRFKYILPVFLFLVLTACFKKEEYPVEPVIVFDRFTITGDSARLSLEFTDGDGNIGLRDDQVAPPYDPASFYHYNLYIEYWEKQDGAGWQPGRTPQGDTIVFKYRIKPFTTSEKDEPVKGILEVLIEPVYYNPFSTDNDTIKYKITLIDRDLHLSNKLETQEIIR